MEGADAKAVGWIREGGTNFAKWVSDPENFAYTAKEYEAAAIGVAP